MALKLNKNWILLGAAIALGLVAMALSNRVISARISQIEDDARRGQEMVRVVVASRDLQRGEALSADAVAVRKVPKEYVHHTAIRPDQFESVDRQRLAVPLRRGEVLLEAHTEGKGASVFSATLKKGLRALTFEVDAVNSISGMLRPGDRIDLIYAARSAAGVASQEFAVPLMSDVVVMATGQTVSKDRGSNDNANRTYSTVTLEVSPVDANRIILAKTGGRLTAVLRNPDDHDRNGTGPMSVASLLGLPAPDVQDRPGHIVQFIIGGRGAPGKMISVIEPPSPATKN